MLRCYSVALDLSAWQFTPKHFCWWWGPRFETDETYPGKTWGQLKFWGNTVCDLYFPQSCPQGLPLGGSLRPLPYCCLVTSPTSPHGAAAALKHLRHLSSFLYEKSPATPLLAHLIPQKVDHCSGGPSKPRGR